MKTILVSLLLLSCGSLFAQYEEDEKPFNFGVGPMFSIPLGDLKGNATYGIGLEVQPSYSLSENIETFLQTGLHVFNGYSSYGSSAANILHIPIMIGARFKASGFFAGAAAGYSIWSTSGESLKGFMYRPQIGYDFGRFEVSGSFTATKVTDGTFSYVGIRGVRKF